MTTSTSQPTEIPTDQIPLPIDSALAVVLVEISVVLPLGQVLLPFARSGITGVCMFGLVVLLKYGAAELFDIRTVMSVACVVFGTAVYAGNSSVFNRKSLLGVSSTLSNTRNLGASSNFNRVFELWIPPSEALPQRGPQPRLPPDQRPPARPDVVVFEAATAA